MWPFNSKQQQYDLKIYTLNIAQALEISVLKSDIKELEWEKYIRNGRLDTLESAYEILERLCGELKTQNIQLIDKVKDESTRRIEATRIGSMNSALKTAATITKSSYNYQRSNCEFEFVNGLCEKLQDNGIKYERELVCDGGRIDVFIHGVVPKIIEAKVDAYPSLVKKAVSQLKRYAQSFPNAELYFAAPREPVGEACSILQEHNISVWTEQAISGVVQ